MILSLYRIYAAPKHVPVIIDVLQSAQIPCASMSNCLESTVFVEAGDNGALLYLEKWSSREALDEYLRSSAYLRVLEALELSCRKPDIAFFDVSEMGGLELVELARSPSLPSS